MSEKLHQPAKSSTLFRLNALLACTAVTFAVYSWYQEQIPAHSEQPGVEPLEREVPVAKEGKNETAANVAAIEPTDEHPDTEETVSTKASRDTHPEGTTWDCGNSQCSHSHSTENMTPEFTQLLNSMRRNFEELTVTEHPDGMVSVDTSGFYAHAMAAHVNEDGSITAHCYSSAHALLKHLNGQPRQISEPLIKQGPAF